MIRIGGVPRRYLCIPMLVIVMLTVVNFLLSKQSAVPNIAPALAEQSTSQKSYPTGNAVQIERITLVSNSRTTVASMQPKDTFNNQITIANTSIFSQHARTEYIVKSFHKPTTKNATLVKHIKSYIKKRKTKSEQCTPIGSMIEADFNETMVNTLERLTVLTYKQPEKPELISGHWQTVGGHVENYIFSAYYDDRPTLRREYVRVIGVFETPVKGHENTTDILCVFWYHKGKPVLTHAQKTKVGVRYPRHWKYFDPSIMSCRLPASRPPPTAVSLITEDYVNNKKQCSNASGSCMSQGCVHLANYIRVQVPEKPKVPMDIGMCMSVVYWHHEPARVVEWVELHRMWGVGEITVYTNSLSPDTLHALQYYTNDSYIDLRQAPGCMPDTGELTILMNMSPVINDCMYRNMYRYRKVMCSDLDEIIVPRKHQNYKELIRDTNYRSQNKDFKYQSYMFRNVYFYLDFPPVATEPWYLITTRYMRRVQPSEYGISVKTITDPLVCVGLQNHVCWHLAEGYRVSGWLEEVDPEVGMLHHYKKCHLDLKEDKGLCTQARTNWTEDRSLMRIDKELEYRVANTLVNLNILPSGKS